MGMINTWIRKFRSKENTGIPQQDVNGSHSPALEFGNLEVPVAKKQKKKKKQRKKVTVDLPPSESCPEPLYDVIDTQGQADDEIKDVNISGDDVKEDRVNPLYDSANRNGLSYAIIDKTSQSMKKEDYASSEEEIDNGPLYEVVAENVTQDSSPETSDSTKREIPKVRMRVAYESVVFLDGKEEEESSNSSGSFEMTSSDDDDERYAVIQPREPCDEVSCGEKTEESNITKKEESFHLPIDEGNTIEAYYSTVDILNKKKKNSKVVVVSNQTSRKIDDHEEITNGAQKIAPVGDLYAVVEKQNKKSKVAVLNQTEKKLEDQNEITNETKEVAPVRDLYAVVEKQKKKSKADNFQGLNGSHPSPVVEEVTYAVVNKPKTSTRKTLPSKQTTLRVKPEVPRKPESVKPQTQCKKVKPLPPKKPANLKAAVANEVQKTKPLPPKKPSLNKSAGSREKPKVAKKPRRADT